MRPEKAEALEKWEKPLADGEYPDRESLLSAEMQRGKELLEQLADGSCPEVCGK